ncbi:hypothetical protein DFH28DRAFT_1181355 [Melampsora americana]|nr:hypothetical protein DFH28DRAFT_1181355 [Melampsora americana]
MAPITGNDNRYWTLLCLQQLAQQELAKEAASSPTGWESKSNFAEQLKKLMCLTIRDPFIQSDTETWDQDKAIIPGLFHWKAMQAIMGKSPDWTTEYLPQLLRDIVVPQHKITLKEPPTNVPNLGFLLALLYQFFDTNKSCTRDKLLKAVNKKTQARFAYLRMSLGIYHNTSVAERKAQGGMSNWRIIDHKLAELCSNNREYCQAFNAIVLARDQGLFNGKNKWDEIETNDQLQIPSKDNITTAIPFLPANAS